MKHEGLHARKSARDVASITRDEDVSVDDGRGREKPVHDGEAIRNRSSAQFSAISVVTGRILPEH